MTIETYLHLLRVKRARLLKRETDFRRRAALVSWTDSRICVSPLLHRRYWRRTICGMCAILNEWLSASEVA